MFYFAAPDTRGLCHSFTGHQLQVSAASTPVRRVEHTSAASTPVRRVKHTSAASSLVHRVEYIFDYRVLAQTRLAMLEGFSLKICIYSHSEALTKGYGSRQQTTEILRASPNASTSTHPQGLLRVDVDCCS
jgi:hypothetical protein